MTSPKNRESIQSTGATEDSKKLIDSQDITLLTGGERISESSAFRSYIRAEAIDDNDRILATITLISPAQTRLSITNFLNFLKTEYSEFLGAKIRLMLFSGRELEHIEDPFGLLQGTPFVNTLDSFKPAQGETELVFSRFAAPTTASTKNSDRITLDIADDSGKTVAITPSALSNHIGPYLEAIEELQHVIDEIKGKEQESVRVLSIEQGSVNVNLQGAGEAIEVVREDVVTWRRKHARNLAALAEREKQAKIDSLNAERLEIEARAAREKAEVDRLQAAAWNLYEEAEAKRIENRRAELKLQEEQIEMVLGIITKLNPNLSEAQRLQYAMSMIPSIRELIESPLMLVDSSSPKEDA